MKHRIDLNADVAEGWASDADLMPFLTSANIACGAHAGDAGTMRATVELARRHGVAIGAHPGFPDRAHFGRRELPLLPREVTATVVEQLKALQAVAAPAGAGIDFVKPHGALYHQTARDPAFAEAFVAAIAAAAGEGGDALAPRVVTLAGCELAKAAKKKGLAVGREAFADRTYRTDGSLTPRSAPNALVADEDAAALQVLRIVRDSLVVASDGTEVPMEADTICLHGDGPHAVALARRLRAALESAGLWCVPWWTAT